MNSYSYMAAAMTTKNWITIGIILAVTALIIFVLYRYGRKLQRRQAESEAQIESMKQYVSLLVIDKKKLRPKESGLPEAALGQIPWYAKRSKIPIVKAKIGPQIMSLMCDGNVFDVIPIKKECKVGLSGIYISELKSVRGSNIPDPPKKQKWYKRIFRRNR